MSFKKIILCKVLQNQRRIFVLLYMAFFSKVCYNIYKSEGLLMSCPVMFKTGGIYQWQKNIVTFFQKVMLQ